MKTRTRDLGLCALALFLHSFAVAQERGQITGRVHNADGDPVQQVTLTLTHENSGRQWHTTPEARGRYRFEFLPAGPYRLQSEAPGYTVGNRAGIQVATAGSSLPEHQNHHQ